MKTASNGVHKPGPNTLYTVLSLLVSVLLLLYLFKTISFSEVMALFQKISGRFVIVFVLFSLAMSLFRTWRYHLVLARIGYSVNEFPLFLITLVRNLFSDLLPARIGTLVYIYLVQNRLGIPFGAAAASFALSFVFDIVVLALLIVAAALFLSSDILSTRVLLSSGILLAFLSISVLHFLPVILRWCGRLCLSLRFIAERMRMKISRALVACADDTEFARSQGLFRPLLILSFGVRCCKYLALYSLLLAFVVPLGFTPFSFPLPKVFLGLCSAELASSLPVSGIAGFGAYEGAWILVFKLLGYSEQLAALTSISHHLFTQVYGYSLGGVALLVLILPYFRRSATGRMSKKQVRAGAFRQVMKAGLVFIIPLAFFLVSINDRLVDGLENNDRHGSQSGWTVSQQFPKNISGMVVYQRPQGIYVVQMGEGTPPYRVAVKGSNPRWSPDGEFIAYRKGNQILLVSGKGGKSRLLAVAKKAGALCFAPDGRAIYYTDSKAVRRVDFMNMTVTTVVDGEEFLEIDAAKGGRLAATVRTPFGYRVIVYDLKSGRKRKVAAGCSASLSPEGDLVTVNGQNHLVLSLFDWDSLRVTNRIHAAGEERFDNQFWSNDPDWIASTSEGKDRDILLHYIPGKKTFQVTTTGDCDRGDFFVSGRQ